MRFSTLPPRVAEMDYRSVNLRVETVRGATRRTLVVDQMLRLVRPLGVSMVWVQRVWPGGDLPALGFTDVAGVLLPPRRGTRVRRVQLDKFKADWVVAPGVAPDAPVLLYFHGGGLRVGGLRTYRRIASNLSALTGSRVFLAGFRLMPRARLEETLSDALTAYRWLLDNGEIADRIVTGGDSGGGQMAIHAALSAREAGLPVPAGTVMFSPWVDYDQSTRSAHHSFRMDPLISPRLAEVIQRWVATGVLDPSLGAVNADLTGIAPVLIQVSSTETLCADAELLARRLSEAGVSCHLQIWDRQMHVFQAGSDVLPEARAALAQVREFIHQVTTAERAAHPVNGKAARQMSAS